MPGTSQTYMSKRANLTIRLRAPVRTNVNGKEYRKPGLRANFMNNRLMTSDPELIKELDSLLTGDTALRWQRRFYKIPPPELISRIAQSQEKAQAVAKAELEKSMTKKQREEFEGWQSFLKRTKLSTIAEKHTTKPASVRKSAEPEKPVEALE